MDRRSQIWSKFSIMSVLETVQTGLLSAAGFIAVILTVVTVHELGHFFVGRWFGIGVRCFAIGFGPAVVRRQDRSGVEWRLNAIPLGGYVQFLGQEEASVPSDPHSAADTLQGASLLARAATYAAGPVANILLAIPVFAVASMLQFQTVEPPEIATVPARWANLLMPGDQLLSIDGIPLVTSGDLRDASEAAQISAGHRYTLQRHGSRIEVTGPHPFPPLVASVAAGSPAAAAGLRPGDLIVAVNWTPVTDQVALSAAINAASGREVVLDLDRDGGRHQVSLLPLPKTFDDGTQGFVIGITGSPAFQLATYRPGPLEAAALAVGETGRIVLAVLDGVGSVLTLQAGTCDLSGPLAIADLSGQAIAKGPAIFLRLLAALSVMVAVMNLVPIPVLDGGHLALCLYEALAGRAPTPGMTVFLQRTGLTILLALMLSAVVADLFC